MGITVSEFGREMTSLIPRFMKEFMKRQADIVTSGELTIAQMGILMILKAQGTCRMSDIAGAISVTLPAATGMVDRMVKAGFLKRAADKRDRRVVRIELTRKGRSVINDITMRREEMICDIFSDFTSVELEQYVRLVRKAVAHIKEEQDKEGVS